MAPEELLRRAIKTGEILRIRYQGGSQPGSVREIIPRRLDNGHLHATCLASNAPRQFLVDKLEIVGADATGPEYDLEIHRQSRMPKGPRRVRKPEEGISIVIRPAAEPGRAFIRIIKDFFWGKKAG